VRHNEEGVRIKGAHKGNADDADYYDLLRFLIDNIIDEIKWG
jgi:hypothetical protein